MVRPSVTRTVFVLVLVILAVLVGVFFGIFKSNERIWLSELNPPRIVSNYLYRFTREEFATSSLLFVGDVMLSRGVEWQMAEHGSSYPYKRIQAVFDAYDEVIGNFEGTVPREHVPTPSMGFSFSVDASAIPALSDAGFSIMTLANNHGHDFGESAYLHTGHVLSDVGVKTAGHPLSFKKSDILVFEAGSIRIALLPIHTVWQKHATETVAATIAYAETVSDVQIVLPHWGQEYEPVHSLKENELARSFVHAGADAIIGHHPHVIQDVDVIDGVPVFYSLGNFIFDQYWNNDVQDGLMVGMHIREKEIEFELIPVTSRDRKSSPRLMTDEEKKVFLEGLIVRSNRALADDIHKGRIVVPISW